MKKSIQLAENSRTEIQNIKDVQSVLLMQKTIWILSSRCTKRYITSKGDIIYVLFSPNIMQMEWRDARFSQNNSELSRMIAARVLATYLIPGCVGRGVRLGSENSSGAGGVWAQAGA